MDTGEQKALFARVGDKESVEWLSRMGQVQKSWEQQLIDGTNNIYSSDDKPRGYLLIFKHSAIRVVAMLYLAVPIVAVWVPVIVIVFRVN